MTAHGEFHWNELLTRDAGKAKDFYGKTLGWTFEDMPMPNGTTHTIIKSNGEIVGGVRELSGPRFEDVPSRWMSYIAVDDIDKRLKALTDAGGQVTRGPWNVESIGRIAIVTDPEGVEQGWMTPDDSVS